MKLRYKKIKVHKFLHELLGKETSGLDLLAIVLASIALTVTVQVLANNLALSLPKNIILVLLTMDIGGGVVANFTEGTNNYYTDSMKKKYLFVSLHVIQPLLLGWIFPLASIALFSSTLYTLICTLFIINIKEYNTQRISAATLLILGIMLLFLLNPYHAAIQLIIIAYSIKLILAFAVNWASFASERSQ
jgi:hypothetical protein